MTSPERRKGNDFETEIVKFLQSHGFPFAERAYGAGRPDDRGDIDGIPGWVLEAKCHKSLDLAGWANEAEAEAANARAPWWAVIAKRRGKPVEMAYVVMSLRQFAELLAEDEASGALPVGLGVTRSIGARKPGATDRVVPDAS